MTARRTHVALAILAGLFIAASTSHAQENLGRWLNPRFGIQKTQVSAGTRYYWEEDVPDSRADFQATWYELNAFVPVHQNEVEEWAVLLGFDVLDTATSATFPRTGVEVPDHLYDVDFGLGYRRKLENDWIVGGAIVVGSASDQPFDSGEEISVTANAFLRIPHNEQLAWLVLLNLSSDRSFLPWIPIPGVAVQWTPSRDFRAVLGFPFSSVTWQPTPELTLEASYALLTNAHAKISYQLHEKVSVYGAFDWDNASWARSDRRDDDHRIFLHEKRVTGGVRVEIIENLMLDAHAGYAFNRFLFEDDNWGDRDDNRISLGDGAFVGVQLSYKF